MVVSNISIALQSGNSPLTIGSTCVQQECFPYMSDGLILKKLEEIELNTGVSRVYDAVEVIGKNSTTV